ncbi:hypothetical protein ACRQ5Q_22595 [Bradyrhizobium sp. PMVTL-01]|uniref:hypothetical protein n=1 Tax=Bradyrhizobium sp. PMVTL-01 TaxID=3434999 RepID=UPI003F723071
MSEQQAAPQGKSDAEHFNDLLKNEASRLRALADYLDPVTAAQTEELRLEWRDGPPPKPWSEEWFIAETTFGDRVCLTALPEEWTYDFKTADDTYIKADKINRWMQFPDSAYIAPETATDDLRKAAEFAKAAIDKRLCDGIDDDLPVAFEELCNALAADYARLAMPNYPNDLCSQAKREIERLRQQNDEAVDSLSELNAKMAESRAAPRSSESDLPNIPDDDSDFTPDLARKIIRKYQTIIGDLRRQINAQQQVTREPGEEHPVLKRADELHDLGFKAGWSDAIEQCAKIVDDEATLWPVHIGSSARVAASKIRALAAHPATAPVKREEEAGVFDAWFDGRFPDPDRGTSHLPNSFKDDLRSAWNAALAITRPTSEPRRAPDTTERSK